MLFHIGSPWADGGNSCSSCSFRSGTLVVTTKWSLSFLQATPAAMTLGSLKASLASFSITDWMIGADMVIVFIGEVFCVRAFLAQAKTRSGQVSKLLRNLFLCDEGWLSVGRLKISGIRTERYPMSNPKER